MKVLALCLALAVPSFAADLRLGIVGCDTSHVTAFTEILNSAEAKNHVAGARVVAVVKGSSADIPESFQRADGYLKELKEKWGVKEYDSIEEMCRNVDAVLIESVDGRPHLAQARAALAAKKPVFIDKPIAASLADALAIAKLAKDSGVPVWTGSSYRWYKSMVELQEAKVGEVRAAISYGPAHLEEHQEVSLSWYGVHPVEALYTVMGQGCESVSCVKTAESDVVVGQWKRGRTGTLVGLRTKTLPHQVTVFGTTGFAQQKLDAHDYAPLVAEIVKFCQTGKAPVPMAETIEMFAFMAAADESGRRGGAAVKLSEMLEKAGK
jgi:predicted dehydrogenase